MSWKTCVVVCLGLSISLTAQAAEVTLKNDTFAGQALKGAIQSGFVSGESFASVFEPPSYPFWVKRVRALITHAHDGVSSTNTYTLKVWQDDAGSVTPGTLLHEVDIQITSSVSDWSEIDVAAAGITITSGHVRVALTQHHNGTPSIVRDDGPRVDRVNLIHGDLGGGLAWVWIEVVDPLFLGNWLIRAIGEENAAPDGGVPQPADAGPADSAPEAAVADDGSQSRPDAHEGSDSALQADGSGGGGGGCSVTAPAASSWIVILLLGMVRRRACWRVR